MSQMSKPKKNNLILAFVLILWLAGLIFVLSGCAFTALAPLASEAASMFGGGSGVKITGVYIDRSIHCTSCPTCPKTNP